MKTALILTTGSSAGPLIKSINDTIKIDKNPILHFVVTKEATKTMEEVLEKFSQFRDSHEMTHITNENDFNETFEEVKKIISKYEKEYDKVILDITGGTKVMSAGALLAIIDTEKVHVRYVGGGKRDSAHRVITGTEKVFNAFGPETIENYSDKKLLKEFFKTEHFSACIKIAKRIETKALTHPQKMDYNKKILIPYYEALDAWDRFEYKLAAEKMEGVCKIAKGFWPFDEKIKNCLLEQSSHLRAHLNIIASEKPSNVKLKNYTLIKDLYVNALRCEKQGYYDDGVSRLYRLIELCAQTELFLEYNVNILPGNDKLPKRTTGKQAINKLKEKELNPPDFIKNDNEPMKIGVKHSFELLQIFESPIGKKFDGKAVKILNARNASFLGHGTNPVSKKSFEKLKELSETLMDYFKINYKEPLELQYIPPL